MTLDLEKCRATRAAADARLAKMIAECQRLDAGIADYQNRCDTAQGKAAEARVTVLEAGANSLEANLTAAIKNEETQTRYFRHCANILAYLQHYCRGTSELEEWQARIASRRAAADCLLAEAEDLRARTAAAIGAVTLDGVEIKHVVGGKYDELVRQANEILQQELRDLNLQFAKRKQQIDSAQAENVALFDPNRT